MKQSKQIKTKELSSETIWTELRDFLKWVESQGLREAEILFGFAWGNYIYPTKDWVYIKLPLADIETRLKDEEKNLTGKLGSDDLYIRHPDLPFELQFCHESDIHIWFESTSPMLGTIFADWKRKGFAPTEWMKENDKWIEANSVISGPLDKN